ncbi:hypothetical protein GCM10011369_11800 [Neiella marina]|uniref:Periplasmic binding protein domain-containing protein n=2 Tax=Neiella marina TaxID=508461 RepID=A0A8J2U3Q8_9GAMM|nr:hypothetical protein GCM10011369_11800 [Neiella marina]
MLTKVRRWGWLAALTMVLVTPSSLCRALGHDVDIVPLKSQASFEHIASKSETLKIAYLPPAIEYNFYLDVWKGIAEVAGEQGHQVFQLAPQTDKPAEQMDMLQAVIEQQVDAIILATHDEQAAAPLIQRATAQGIVVVIVNSDALSHAAPVHAVVGYVQRKGTYQLGQYAASLISATKRNVAILEGEPGYHSTERVAGFEKAIGEAAMPVVARANGRWNTEGGYNATLQLFRQQSDIDVIFAANDFEVIGAAAALKAINRTDVLLFGNDGVADVLPYIRDGSVQATVYTNPVLMGKMAMAVAVDSVEGQFRGGFVETPTSLISGDNVAEYLVDTTALANDSELTVVSEELVDLTNADGSGLYWDILRAIYQPRGIEVIAKVVPLKRAQLMTEKSHADAMLGHHRGDSTQMIFPQWHYGSQQIYALFSPARLNWQGISTLQGTPAAWVRGANYDAYLPLEMQFEQSIDHLGPLLMLASGRVDVVLDDGIELQKNFRRHAERLMLAGFDSNEYQLEKVLDLKLYLAFTNTAKGRKMANIFDEQLPMMLRNGQLEALYRKWQISDFPF